MHSSWLENTGSPLTAAEGRQPQTATDLVQCVYVPVCARACLRACMSVRLSLCVYVPSSQHRGQKLIDRKSVV